MAARELTFNKLAIAQEFYDKLNPNQGDVISGQPDETENPDNNNPDDNNSGGNSNQGGNDSQSSSNNQGSISTPSQATTPARTVQIANMRADSAAFTALDLNHGKATFSKECSFADFIFLRIA